jgi:hypothetical protein
MQNQTFSVLSALYSTGIEFVPLWLPSQKGWFLLRPQEHHQ